MVFPAYSEMKNRSNSRFSEASASSIVMQTIFYICIGFAGVLMLGPNDINEDFLKHIANRPGAVSVALRFLFCLLIILDMPFMYISVKE